MARTVAEHYGTQHTTRYVTEQEFQQDLPKILDAMDQPTIDGINIWYGFLPGWQVTLLPLFILLAVAASLGPALWITALNVKYRDFRYVIPFILQFGLYVSPVGFSSTVVPEQWRFWYSLNPVVGVIDGFRWCLLGGESRLYMPGFLLSLGVVFFFLGFGVYYFRKTEKTFADLL